MRLISSDFSDGAKIPRVSTCEGEDASPALQWSDAPPETRSFALICFTGLFPARRKSVSKIGALGASRGQPQCEACAGPFGATTLRMNGTSRVAMTKAIMMARKASA